MTEEIELTLGPEFEELEDNEVIEELPDTDLDPESIEKIKRLFDAGSTKSTIAKELGLKREDVIEVLGKYVGRSKINGVHTQEVAIKDPIAGRVKVKLNDRANTVIYVRSGKSIEAAKEKWLKLLNNNND